MTRFSVAITGDGLDKGRMALEKAAGLSPVGPPFYKFVDEDESQEHVGGRMHVRLDADSAEQVEARVREHLPEGNYIVEARSAD